MKTPELLHEAARDNSRWADSRGSLHGRVIEVLPDGRCVIELEVHSQFVTKPLPPEEKQSENMITEFGDDAWREWERRDRDARPWNPEEDNSRGGR